MTPSSVIQEKWDMAGKWFPEALSLSTSSATSQIMMTLPRIIVNIVDFGVVSCITACVPLIVFHSFIYFGNQRTKHEGFSFGLLLRDNCMFLCPVACVGVNWWGTECLSFVLYGGRWNLEQRNATVHEILAKTVLAPKPLFPQQVPPAVMQSKNALDG